MAEHDEQYSIRSLPPLGGVQLDTAEAGAAPEIEERMVDLASTADEVSVVDGEEVDAAAMVAELRADMANFLSEALRSSSAPLQARKRITVQTTFPNAVASGRLSGEVSSIGLPLWLGGTHWTPQGGPGIQIHELNCDCAIPTAELPAIEQTKPPCGSDRAKAHRFAAQGFDGTCLPKGSDWKPREKLERQTSLGLATLIARQTIAATARTGLVEDGITPGTLIPGFEDDGTTPLPLGDLSGGKCICVHKAWGVLTGARESRGDGTLGAIVTTSMLESYLTVEKNYVVRVGNHWETKAGDRVLFAPANELTGPNGEAGLWIYSVNGVDWVTTDVEDFGDQEKTIAQLRGNRNPVPPAGRYGLARVDSAEAYGVCVVAGCESCEEDVTP